MCHMDHPWPVKPVGGTAARRQLLHECFVLAGIFSLSLQDQTFVNLCLRNSVKAGTFCHLVQLFSFLCIVSVQEKKLQCQSGSSGSCPIQGAGILQCWKRGILHPMPVEQARI